MSNDSKFRIGRSKEAWLEDLIEYYEFYDVDEMNDELWIIFEMIIESKSFRQLDETDQCNYIFRLRLLGRMQKAAWEVYGEDISKSIKKNRG
ncbi:hypothetical protein [Deminuibacter soli]|uniref:Uncharacterized protein n=1 Tax=Deminuibacter soli TaxID=2291815 RepID=A0A3E1NL87_9BACT|nr:hypothetical protein [Deminuibacter soli]RFM28548.1 hypothetical protein DXN05_07020 [Deminuibacter soli]